MDAFAFGWVDDGLMILDNQLKMHMISYIC